MSMGSVELERSKSLYHNPYQYNARGLNAAGSPASGGTNPFSLSPSTAVRAAGTPAINSPQKPAGTMAQLNQAIQPSVHPSKLNIGMNDPNVGANQESGKANQSESQGQKAANSMDKGAGKMKIDDNTPGKALAEDVKQTQREVRDVSKETMANKSKGGIGSMGGDDTSKLTSVSSSLNETGQSARRADMEHKKGDKLNIMSKIKDVASMCMKSIGKALEATGNALTAAGQSLISAGKPLLSNPFTAAAGAAMIAAGTALKVAGKALKIAGKGIQKAAMAMEKVAKGMGSKAKNLLKKSSQQVAKGKQKIQKARTTLQKIRESSRKKAAQALRKKRASGTKGVKGVKPANSGASTSRVDGVSQKFKVNRHQPDHSLVSKTSQGNARSVGKSKTLDDFAQPNKGLNKMRSAKNGSKVKPANAKPDPKATEALQKVDPKKLEGEQALLQKTSTSVSQNTAGTVSKGSKGALARAKQLRTNATAKAKAFAEKHPKMVTAAKWGGGMLAGGYVMNKMMGGAQQQSAYTGPVYQRQERFATQEEFDRHYGFDKPLDIPNYQSGYSQYYNSQRTNGRGQNPQATDPFSYNGNSLLNNDSPLFTPNLAMA